MNWWLVWFALDPDGFSSFWGWLFLIVLVAIIGHVLGPAKLLMGIAGVWAAYLLFRFFPYRALLWGVLFGAAAGYLFVTYPG